MIDVSCIRMPRCALASTSRGLARVADDRAAYRRARQLNHRFELALTASRMRCQSVRGRT